MALSTEFKVGVFTIIGLGTLGGTALMIQGSSFLHKKNHFVAELPNASGVAERTQVRVAGVQVGSVTKVRVEPHGAEIQFDVRSSIAIPVDSHLEIKSRGMLGDVFVEIERGQSTQLFASGATIPVEGDAADMQKLIANMNSIALDVKKITSTLTDALNGEGENNLKAMITNLENTAANIAKLVAENDTKITSIIDNISSFTAQLSKLATDENREKVANIIDNLDASTSDIKKMTAKIEKGEGTLGQLISKDETADEIKKTLADIQHTVSPFAGLHIGLEDRFEYRFRNAEQGSRVENQFNVMFSTTPDRFYLIGLVNSQYGRKVTDSTTVVDGNTTTVYKNIPENTWLWKWNVQVSQRLSFIGADWIGLRVGFFRSTPGFAIDLYTPRNMFMASAEFYDFDGFPMATDPTYGKRHVMNVKLYGDLFLTPNLYLTAGVVNLVLLDQPWPFFGAGVFFTDRDIRGLFASTPKKEETSTAQIESVSKFKSTQRPKQKRKQAPFAPEPNLKPVPPPVELVPDPIPEPIPVPKPKNDPNAIPNPPPRMIAPEDENQEKENTATTEASNTNISPVPSPDPDPYPYPSPNPDPQPGPIRPPN